MIFMIVVVLLGLVADYLYETYDWEREIEINRLVKKSKKKQRYYNYERR